MRRTVVLVGLAALISGGLAWAVAGAQSVEIPSDHARLCVLEDAMAVDNPWCDPPTTTTEVPPSTTTSSVPSTSTTEPPSTTAPPSSTTSEPSPPSTPSPTTTAPAPTTTAHQHAHVVCPGEQDPTPMGALPPAKSMLCDPLAPAVDTHTETANGWLDEFNHHASMAELPDAYVQGTVGGGGVAKHFLHNEHWMVDIRSDSGTWPTQLAAWMRPDRTFTTKPDGSVVIEFEVATPIAGTRDVALLSDSWPEFAISPAPAPTGMNPWGSEWVRNGTYFYEAFAKAEVFGCRIQQSRHPICAYYVAGSDGAGSPDRQWELNQNGTDVTFEYGGDPTIDNLGAAWATCSNTDDPDTVCRNHFRWTLTANSVRMDVRKPGGEWVRFYEAHPINDRNGETGQLSRILSGPFYVYFADFAYRIENDGLIRFHWDRLAVNP